MCQFLDATIPSAGETQLLGHVAHFASSSSASQLQNVATGIEMNESFRMGLFTK